MLTRCLFAFLALAAVGIILLPAPGLVPEATPWSFLSAVLLLCIGMAVPWGRWMHLVSPGQNLGFVTKLFGWGGASAFLLFLESREWLGVWVGALLSACALALWKGRTWAAWPWYAVALVALAIAATSAMYSVAVPIWIGPLNPRTEVAGAIITYLSVGVWILFWTAIGVVLPREITAWRRRMLSAAGSTSAY